MSTTFIFRPGGVADPANNIYVTWPTLMTALSAASGSKILQFDDSITTPIVIPAGTYSMQSVTWGVAPTANNPCALNLSEGRIFTALRTIVGTLRVTFSGATPPVSDFAAGDMVSIDGGAIVRCSGTGPFFRNTVVGGQPVMFALGTASWLAVGGNPVFDSSVVGAFTMIAVSAFNTTINANQFMGVDGSTIAIVNQVFSLGVTALAPSNVSETQPNFNGTLLPVDSPRFRLRVLPAVVVNTTVTALNQVVCVDPSSGPVTITLPSVKGSRGQQVIVKNVSASSNPITVAPAAAETVDGSAVGVTIAAARGSIALVADGTSDWLAI